MSSLIEGKTGAVVFSTKNEASLNIMRHLESDWKWRKHSDAHYSFSSCAKADCCNGIEARGYAKSIIEIEPEFEADYFLYASTHKAESGKPSLTVHIPGNWHDNKFGGEKSTLNMAYANKQKQILQLLDSAAKARKIDWEVCFEVDHHGPTPKGGKQCLIFVEIGSSAQYWGNDLAGAAVAEAIMKSLFRPAPKSPAYIGIGGLHYAPKFSKIALNEDKAIGHIVPEYQMEHLNSEMLAQAIEKSYEKVQGALIEGKGLKAPLREKAIKLCDEAGLKWEKV